MSPKICPFSTWWQADSGAFRPIFGDIRSIMSPNRSGEHRRPVHSSWGGPPVFSVHGPGRPLGYPYKVGQGSGPIPKNVLTADFGTPFSSKKRSAGSLGPPLKRNREV